MLDKDDIPFNNLRTQQNDISCKYAPIIGIYHDTKEERD